MMEIKKKKELVPALRFGEFDGEWSISKIIDLFTIKAGGDIDKKNVREKKDKEFKYPIYANAKAKKGLYGYSNLYKANENVITIAGRGVNIGITHARDHKFYPIVRLLVLAPKLDYDIYFFEHEINRLNVFIESTGVPQLTSPQISLYNVKYPSLPEQKKIATFLSTVDQKIEQLRQKVSLLEQYKKGVLQQIFSQEIRFKEENGEDFADWEVKRFDNVFAFIRTNSFSRSLLNYNSGEVKNIHYGDIHTKFSAQFDITKENVPFVNEDVDISKINKEDYCEEGDLIIADASEDYADIGKSIEVVNLRNQKLVAGLHTYIARPKIQMALGFSCYLMQNSQVRRAIMRIATGVSVLGITKTNLSKLEILIPCFPEQKKIATFLSSIDQKITQTQEQLTQTQAFKKGLLQQLFV
ncbi:MAG: restriction endonuclease subunit S [Aureispira sp.]